MTPNMPAMIPATRELFFFKNRAEFFSHFYLPTTSTKNSNEGDRYNVSH